MVTRLGSVAVVRWTSVLLAPSLVLLTLAPSVPAAALALLWLGTFLGAMDNAMNANGIGVEKAAGRPAMSSFHGFWSLGGMVGGLTGGAMIVTLGEMGHALAVGAIGVDRAQPVAQLGGRLLGERDGGDPVDRHRVVQQEGAQTADEGVRLAGPGPRLDEQGGGGVADGNHFGPGALDAFNVLGGHENCPCGKSAGGQRLAATM